MSTFLNFPKAKTEEIKGFEAVVMGVPFDELSTYRKGPKYAPKTIRKASECYDPYVPDLDFDFSMFNVADLGDIELVPGNTSKSLSKIKDTVGIVSKERVKLMIFGGDHSITLPIAKALTGNHGEIALIWIDAHLDFWDEYPPGTRISHATVLKRILEATDLPPGNVINLGFRAFGSSPEERREAEKHGLKVFSTKELFLKETLEQISALIQELSGNVKALHISVDMDVLDPAFAPGVTNPEPGGISTRELLSLLEIIGPYATSLDIVELAPPYDVSEISAHAAAVIAIQSLGVMLKNTK